MVTDKEAALPAASASSIVPMFRTTASPKLKPSPPTHVIQQGMDKNSALMISKLNKRVEKYEVTLQQLEIKQEKLEGIRGDGVNSLRARIMAKHLRSYERSLRVGCGIGLAMRDDRYRKRRKFRKFFVRSSRGGSGNQAMCRRHKFTGEITHQVPVKGEFKINPTAVSACVVAISEIPLPNYI
eukprot:GHVN01095377.1.p1 GENE.GHVN01095377.1~~GHVN01095377.1.p1  ORF type:complete len:183 (+),score=19.23 GHVN01095377.1:105-653(+)